jgi:hypothetical protein
MCSLLIYRFVFCGTLFTIMLTSFLVREFVSKVVYLTVYIHTLAIIPSYIVYYYVYFLK